MEIRFRVRMTMTPIVIILRARDKLVTQFGVAKFAIYGSIVLSLGVELARENGGRIALGSLHWFRDTNGIDYFSDNKIHIPCQ
jgi:hypothetical protein